MIPFDDWEEPVKAPLPTFSDKRLYARVTIGGAEMMAMYEHAGRRFSGSALLPYPGSSVRVISKEEMAKTYPIVEDVVVTREEAAKTYGNLWEEREKEGARPPSPGFDSSGNPVKYGAVIPFAAIIAVERKLGRRLTPEEVNKLVSRELMRRTYPEDPKWAEPPGPCVNLWEAKDSP